MQMESKYKRIFQTAKC